MKKITSNLIALEVGHTVSIDDDGAAAILTELPTKSLLLDMKDATAYIFELKGEPAEFGKNRTLRFSGHP